MNTDTREESLARNPHNGFWCELFGLFWGVGEAQKRGPCKGKENDRTKWQFWALLTNSKIYGKAKLATFQLQIGRIGRRYKLSNLRLERNLLYQRTFQGLYMCKAHKVCMTDDVERSFSEGKRKASPRITGASHGTTAAAVRTAAGAVTFSTLTERTQLQFEDFLPSQHAFLCYLAGGRSCSSLKSFFYSWSNHLVRIWALFTTAEMQFSLSFLSLLSSGLFSLSCEYSLVGTSGRRTEDGGRRTEDKQRPWQLGPRFFCALTNKIKWERTRNCGPFIRHTEGEAERGGLVSEETKVATFTHEEQRK